MSVSETLEEFDRAFRDEHRTVRNLLFDLEEAFRERNLDEARELLTEVVETAGPHFRYEEEELYPSLVQVFGKDHIDQILGDHDHAIQAIGRLADIVAGNTLTLEMVEEAVELTRSLLPHVSDCQGLSIMVETLPDRKVREILESRERALEDGADLFTWVETLRNRTP